MKITLIRKDEEQGTEALSLCDTDAFFEKVKTENKAGHISELREILPRLAGSSARYVHIDKLPRVYPAVEYTRKQKGEKRMKHYNGLVQLEVNRLADLYEVEYVKRQVEQLPQTFAAFCGSSGRSVKIWVRFARTDGSLPTATQEVLLFHAHAYRLAVTCYLRFASEWLSIGNHATTTTPTKKAALGFLAKACLQTYEYGSTEYLQEALDAALQLISDCESGGGKYNTYMYPTYSEVFEESNNWENKEALWKHRWYAGTDGHGSSNGNYKLNRNDEYFLCDINKFGAREDNQETRLTWEGSISGIFMPTQHLLNLYVQNDGTLDPRFHQSFTTEWKANKSYTWDESAVHMYDKDETVIGKALKKGDPAIKFIMPQDADYSTEKQNEHKTDYLLIDYNHVYSDANNNVNMNYSYTNVTGNYKNDGTSENLFRYYYPSLNKHNSSNYYVANASKQRNGNLNATFIMRMAEVYLIAAEADIYLNGGANAAKYLNKVRERAGANPLTGSMTVRDVLDERGRELCGEYCRFYDLKRTGMFKSSDYLKDTHPDLARFFDPNYALRPISTTFTATIINGSEYQNPGY